MLSPFKKIIKPTVYGKLPPSQNNARATTQNYHDDEAGDEKRKSMDQESLPFLDERKMTQPPPMTLRELVSSPHSWVVGLGAMAVLCLMFLVVVLTVCALVQHAETNQLRQSDEIVQLDFISWWSLHRDEYST